MLRAEHLSVREYDGEVCRFITADNVIDGQYDTQGWNRYAYCHNNPIQYKDPTGHEAALDYAKGGDLYKQNNGWYGQQAETLRKQGEEMAKVKPLGELKKDRVKAELKRGSPNKIIESQITKAQAEALAMNSIIKENRKIAKQRVQFLANSEPSSLESWWRKPYELQFNTTNLGVMTSDYGARKHPLNGKSSFHNGVDIKTPDGYNRSDVLGVITKVGYNGEGLGGFVEITSVNYGTSNNPYVITQTIGHFPVKQDQNGAFVPDINYRQGDMINRGDIIGQQGTTGASTGIHGHFIYKVNGVVTDPNQINPIPNLNFNGVNNGKIDATRLP